MNPPVRFEPVAQDGAARAGILHTRRGPVRTPVFMPVGTYGAVKGFMPDELAACGAQIILANTYHLHVRPGEELVESLGGLHSFCGWSGPMLTDSGGYQVFSLAKLRKLDDEGVTFQDTIEGSTRLLTPEKSIEIQLALGADIIMALDECASEPMEREAAARAMERTLRWLPRNQAACTNPEIALFGIVQGGIFDDLRQESLERTVESDLPGFALGGVCVGESREEIDRIVQTFGPRFPQDKPRYLMGMGRPEDLVDAVSAGFDMFDCVMPTRHGRTAQIFTRDGVINLRNAGHRDRDVPIEEDCGCPICQRFSRAYLRHLFVTGDMLAARAGSVHNLWLYFQVMSELREAICEGRLETYRSEFHRRLRESPLRKAST